MLRATLIVIASAWTAAAVLSSRGPLAPMRLCSLVPIPGFKVVGEPYFLGRALGDTTFAGPGATQVASGRGHYGGAVQRKIYGQYVRVALTGGTDIAPEALNADTVLVVPWDYDPACAPVPWSGSATWLPLDDLRFFYPKLRNREDWVGSMPTYDAFLPGIDVYPSFRPEVPPIQSGIPPGRGEESASADSLFAFFESIPALPTYGEVSDTVLVQLRDWSVAHPVLALTSPIADVLAALARQAAATRARNYLPPMLGTYRITISIPKSRSRTLFLRTADRTDRYGYHSRMDFDADSARHPLEVASLGVNVTFWVATEERDLPMASNQEPGSTTAELKSRWGWHIAWPDSVRANGEWPAEIDPYEFLFEWNEADPAVDAFSDGYEESFSERWEARKLAAWSGAFTGKSQARFRQEVTVQGAGTMVIDARRISRATVRLETD